MKTLWAAFLMTIIASCSKVHEDIITPDSRHVYNLSFQMTNEKEGLYFIQSSADGIAFSTIDSIAVDLSKNGNYSFDIKLREGELVRLEVKDPDSASFLYSEVMKAE